MRKEFDGISRSFFVWDMIEMLAKALAYATHLQTKSCRK